MLESVSSWKHGETTYATRLTLPSKELQLFGAAEFYEDVDGPLLVVFVLADTNFAGTSNPLEQREMTVVDMRLSLTIERSRELLPNALDQILEGRLPVVLFEVSSIPLSCSKHTLAFLILRSIRSTFFCFSSSVLVMFSIYLRG